MTSSMPTKAQIESLNQKILSILDYCNNIESKTSQTQLQYNSLHINEHRDNIFYKLCLYNRFGIRSSLNDDYIMTLFELSNVYYNKNINFFKDLIEKADLLLSSKKEHPGIRKFEKHEDLDKWIILIANSVRTIYSINLKTSTKIPNRKLQNSFLLETDDIGYLSLTELKNKITEEDKKEEIKPKKVDKKEKEEEIKPKKVDKKEKEEEIKPKKVDKKEKEEEIKPKKLDKKEKEEEIKPKKLDKKEKAVSKK
jgi:hypothetical protein